MRKGADKTKEIPEQGLIIDLSKNWRCLRAEFGKSLDGLRYLARPGKVQTTGRLEHTGHGVIKSSKIDTNSLHGISPRS